MPRLWALVLGLLALRWGLLAFDRTDLFVDEAQYWLWAQVPDLGYYSKPPLIAWVIGAVTAVFGDGIMAIRLPGAFLHGVTALLLAATAARRFGAQAAWATGAVYILAPFVAVGSLMMSTDTVMLPLLAAALYCHTRLMESRAWPWAMACGLALGAAALGKYAALYGLAAFLLANVFPASRIGWRASLVMVLATVAALAPNLWWNAANHFATISHTGDNIGWVKGKDEGGGLAKVAEFLASQFVVFGPVAMGAMLVSRRAPRDLLLFAALPLVLVTGQAFMGKAYANWALAAFVPGSLLAGMVLADRTLWRQLGMGLGLAFALALPVLTLVPDWAPFGRPLLERYLGRADLSRQIIGLAQGLPVVADNRDILADLFYTGRGAVTAYAAPQPAPRNFYEQKHSLPQGLAEVLYIGNLPAGCEAQSSLALQGQGVWAGRPLIAHRIKPACLFP